MAIHTTAQAYENMYTCYVVDDCVCAVYSATLPCRARRSLRRRPRGCIHRGTSIHGKWDLGPGTVVFLRLWGHQDFMSAPVRNRKQACIHLSALYIFLSTFRLGVGKRNRRSWAPARGRICDEGEEAAPEEHHGRRAGRRSGASRPCTIKRGSRENRRRTYQSRGAEEGGAAQAGKRGSHRCSLYRCRQLSGGSVAY